MSKETAEVRVYTAAYRVRKPSRIEVNNLLASIVRSPVKGDKNNHSRIISEHDLSLLIAFFRPGRQKKPKTLVQYLAMALDQNKYRYYCHYINYDKKINRVQATNGHIICFCDNPTDDMKIYEFMDSEGNSVEVEKEGLKFPTTSKLAPSAENITLSAEKLVIADLPKRKFDGVISSLLPNGVFIDTKYLFMASAGRAAVVWHRYCSDKDLNRAQRFSVIDNPAWESLVAPLRVD